MYHDYYCKFADEAAAKAVLFNDEEQPRYAAIDMIGTIYKPTGKGIKTPEGPVNEMVPLDGYHANVRHPESAPELDQYSVTPANPVRMWA